MIRYLRTAATAYRVMLEKGTYMSGTVTTELLADGRVVRHGVVVKHHMLESRECRFVGLR